jgi:hypothetical protein
MTTRTVDELIVLAVETDTNLRVFDGEVLVIPGPDLDVSTLPEFHEARCLIAQRLVELFSAENFPIEVGDPDDPEVRRRSPEQAEAERQDDLRREALWNSRPHARLSVPAPGVKQTLLPPPRTRSYAAASEAGEQERAAANSLTDPSVAPASPITPSPTPEPS